MAEKRGKQQDATPVTDEMIQAWADEAERGYDLDEIRSRRSAKQPAKGDGGIPVEWMRVESELKRDG